MSEKEPSELSLQDRIERHIEEDFRADPAGAYEKYGLTASLHRGVTVCFVLMVGFLIIWIVVVQH